MSYEIGSKFKKNSIFFFMNRLMSILRHKVPDRKLLVNKFKMSALI